MVQTVVERSRVAEPRHQRTSSAVAGRLVSYWPVLAFAFVVLALRRPDILLSPQQWAEDGPVWFQQAYNDGPLQALLRTHTSYFQTFSRLVFGISTALPLEHVPVFGNVNALLVRAATIAFLFTRRFGWVDVRAKLVLLAYFLLMPGLEEVHANVTNTHWYLATYLAMVVIAEPPAGRWWQLHDFAVIAIAGLSGPFSTLLAGVMVVAIIVRRWRGKPLGTTIANLVALAVVALIQFIAILLSLGDRAAGPLGADVVTGAAIAVVRIGLGVISPRVAHLDSLQPYLPLMWAIFAAGALVVGLAWWRADWRARIFAALAVLALAATMANPMVSLTEPQWPILLWGGGRYFVLPRMGVVALLVAGAAAVIPPSLRTPTTAGALAVVLLIGLPQFQIPPVPDSGFRAAAINFNRAPPGTTATIPIAPPGWSMLLTKH